jgi:hypothetical protein
MLYVFFWVISRRLNFICQRFGTLCLFYLHRQVGVKLLNLRMVAGMHTGERWLENGLSRLEGGWWGRGGSGYKAGSERVMTRGSLPFHYLRCNRTHPYPVTLRPIGLGYFRAKPPPVWISQLFSNLVIIHLLAYEDGTYRVFRNVCI